MDHERAWAVRLTADVGRRISSRRTVLGLTAQQVAERCAALGMPSISRIVITKLENGRRESVSLAELLVLAQALDTLPALLALPLGREDPTEILPGQMMRTWDATLWLSGEIRLSESDDGLNATWLDWRDEQGIVPLFHRHDRFVEDLTNGVHFAAISAGADGEIDPVATAKLQRGLKKEFQDNLREVRARMRELGLTPPELPDDLAYIDDKGRSRGAR